MAARRLLRLGRGEVARLLIALAVAGGIGCGYAPDPRSGQLLCGAASSCPDGYTCAAGSCWKHGDERFVGHWLFAAPSTTQINCTDGSSSTTDLAANNDYLDFIAGTTSVFTTDYYCNWRLDVSGSSTVIEANQSCMKPDPDPTVPNIYTFHGQTFTFSTLDGSAGTLVASLPFDVVTSPSGTGSCTLRIMGVLTKS